MTCVILESYFELRAKLFIWFVGVFMTSIYMIVCRVERDSVVMKTEADSNDITQYTHDDNTTTGMFHFSYTAFTCLTYCT